MYQNIDKAKTSDSKPSIRSASDCHITQTSNPYNENKLVIALIGRPNSGKTTLFNTLTGSNYKTSNYPGTTVEYSTGKLSKKYNFDCLVFDSPGIISLTPDSPDEEITVNALYDHPEYGLPDIVIVTTDSTQLSRQLYLVKQLVDSGFGTVVALTMNDLLEKNGLQIQIEELEIILNCPVKKIDARTGEGIRELINTCVNKIPTTDTELKVYKPKQLDQKSITELYKFTEETERRVVTQINKKPDLPGKAPDLEKINQKHFNTFTSKLLHKGVFDLRRKLDKNSLRLDRILLHPFLGFITFNLIMGLIFTSIFWIAQPLMDLIDSTFGLISTSLSSILPHDIWYSDLITKGLINGVGSVFLFLPQIVILFIFLGILEDTGYLPRAAMLIDKPLSKFGLNGRSFVPMLSGYACAIPAIMAARTITNKKERLLTILIIPLMSCSARLPVYAMLLAFVVPNDKPWIAGIGLGALYLFSLISGSLVAGIVNKFSKTEYKSTFMLELPAYRKPVLRHILKNTYYKSAIYIKGAGPMIVLISLILWLLTYFPDIRPDIPTEKIKKLTDYQAEKLIESERLNNSYAATIGGILEPALKPLGWDWRIGVSLISAFAAREVFVSAMAITLSITEANEKNLQNSILTAMRQAKISNSDKPLFTTASTIALIIFFMFALQCLATVAVTRKETGSWKIPVLQIILYTGMAYFLAFITYNGLNLIGVN